MSKLLVTGLGPLLEKESRNMGGQCLRTWIFVQALLGAGHTVRLVTLPSTDDPHDPHRKKTALVRHQYEGFQYQGFTNWNEAFIHKTLSQVMRSLNPDAVVAINNLPASIIARMPSRLPFWADLNGYQVAESQGKAAKGGDANVLVEAWRREARIARRADKFSAVSRPQLHALLGELAWVGRLNQHTFHYHFAHRIPNPVHPFFISPAEPAEEPVVRGKEAPKDAFLILWTGGYNYWTDPDFLFQCVDAMLAQNPKARYVSTGGPITGYNETSYARFLEKVEASPHRDRYHLLGWIPGEDLRRLYAEVDLGLCIDSANLETLFGARNRITNLLAAGVPVLTTSGTEVSHILALEKCAYVCPPGKMESITQAAARAAADEKERRAIAQKGRDFALRAWSAEAVLGALLAWCEEPALAPDNAQKLEAKPNLRDLRKSCTNPVEAAAAIAEYHNVMDLARDFADFEVVQKKKWFPLAKRLCGW